MDPYIYIYIFLFLSPSLPHNSLFYLHTSHQEKKFFVFLFLLLLPCPYPYACRFFLSTHFHPHQSKYMFSAFQAYIKSAPRYNFPVYRAVVAEITKSFSSLSLAVTEVLGCTCLKFSLNSQSLLFLHLYYLSALFSLHISFSFSLSRPCPRLPPIISYFYTSAYHCLPSHRFKIAWLF